jgi:hypothetical protein
MYPRARRSAHRLEQAIAVIKTMFAFGPTFAFSPSQFDKTGALPRLVLP